ncbi:UbiA prenyltransferase family protein [Candidatus Binatia bacterium]|nr:UbiA prenyltransferase family protein [Candidatus Binatia bacterium]
MVETILRLNQLIRFHFFGFSSSVALMGLASVDPAPSFSRVLVVLASTFAFHVFTYVQNDVIDLEIDRTQPLRRNDLLVTGRISPAQAMTAALLQLPLSLGLLWWTGAPPSCLAVVVAGYGLMTVYNMYGKRCPFPPLTDLVQGLSWGTLALVGGLSTGRGISPLTVLAAAHGCGFLFLINGVHGGLRDLGNDLACGMRTSAIFFGAVPLPGDEARSSRGLRGFAWLAWTLLVGPWAVAFAVNAFGYDAGTWWGAFVPWLAIQVASALVLRRVVADVTPNRGFIISAHGLPLLLAPIVAFLPHMSTALVSTTLLFFFGPFVAMDPSLESVRGLWRRVQADVAATDPATSPE